MPSSPEPIDRRWFEQLRRLRARHLTRGGTAANVPVTAAATTLAVTFEVAEPDTRYGVVCTPSWMTGVSVHNKTTTGFTVEFSTAAPANSTVDWAVFRNEERQATAVTGGGGGIGGGGGVSDGDKGDVTVSGAGTVWTIDPDVVTFAKMQNINTGRLLGRSTALAGDPEEVSVGSGLSLSGGTLSATGTGTGTLGKLAKWISSTSLGDSIASESGGDIIVSAGTDAATQVKVGAGGASPTSNRGANVELNVPSSGSFPGGASVRHRRNAALVWLTGIDQDVSGQKGSTSDYQWQNASNVNVAALTQAGDLSLAGQLAALSAVLGNPLTAPNGGTGFASYAIGDMLWASATNALAKITGNTTTTRKFLRQVGSAGVPQSPAWDTLVDGDIPATLSANARVAVRKNSTGGAVGTRRQINFIEGSNVTITVADDNANEEVDVTIAAAGGGGSYPWTHIGKPADTGRSATTALTADPDLQVALAANTTYAVRLRVYYGTGTTPDFKYDLNFTGTFLGGQFHRVAWLPSGTQGGIGSDTALNVSVSLTASSGSRGFIEIFGRLGVGASGGTFSFRWAQNTSDPGTTSVFTGSELMYMVIN